jgi:catechol-2,3-dioxygenase
MKLSYIGLVVGNIEKAAKIYSEKLGLNIKIGDPKSGGRVALDLGLCLLFLIPKDKADGRPAGEFSFCFELPDALQLEIKVDELREKGLNPVMGPYRSSSGQSVVRYAGSDNEVIELVAPTA